MQLLKIFTIAALAVSATAQAPLPDCDGLANAGFAVRDHIKGIAENGWMGSSRDAAQILSNDIDHFLGRALRSCQAARDLITSTFDSQRDADDRACELFGC